MHSYIVCLFNILEFLKSGRFDKSLKAWDNIRVLSGWFAYVFFFLFFVLVKKVQWEFKIT